MAKVAHVIPIAQHLGELCGVGGLRRVLVSISVGHAIAYAGDADRVLCLCGADAKAKQQSVMRCFMVCSRFGGFGL